MRFLTGLMGFIRWVYFLRFSLALWLFPLVLVGINMLNKTLTSGILVPEFPQGYLCVAFFLVSSGFAALIAARVVLIKGPERWNECKEVPEKRQPTPLDWLLVNDKSDWEWLAVVAALVPALLTGRYLIHFGSSQDVARVDIIAGLLFGMVVAGFVWYVANVWYYFTYDAPEKAADGEPTTVELGKTAARTILYPRRWLGLSLPGENPAENKNRVEIAETLLTSKQLSGFSDRLAARIVAITGQRGYAYKGGTKLYEAQIFAIIAMVVFVGFYLLVWPMAAPVPSLYMSIASLAILLVGIVLATVVFWSAKPAPELRGWKIGLTAGVVVFWVLVAYLYLCTSAERFPIFATMLIMAISGLWTLAGFAFFADCYRVPIFTLLLLAMILPRLPLFSLLGGHEEHYFSTLPFPGKLVPIPSPAAILDEKLNTLGTDRPLIVVTATGGGLHASAWTAAVLARLEAKFSDKSDSTGQEPFHSHLLLLSTVSGGSVGLSNYLRELIDHILDGPSGLEHMQTAAQCSSLEAVGWGLVYYDQPKAFIPRAPYVLPLSNGDGDLDLYKTPLFKDRTWALRKGIERNEVNRYCELGWRFDRDNYPRLTEHKEPVSQLLHHSDPRHSILDWVLLANLSAEATNRQSKNQMTLRNLLPAKENGLPAFTMNTTSVERGDRYLLANYQVPHYSLGAPDVYPAQSFHNSFGNCGSQVSDLPLATAAQLSATFPYVSSAARAPNMPDQLPDQQSSQGAASEHRPCHSVHFVDGGYYDNDGTGSAVEFLRYALAPSNGEGVDEDEKKHLSSIETRLRSSPLRILWIEIRNSGDADVGETNDLGGNGSIQYPDPDNLLGQVKAVPLGFWNAGHESVTGRTRVALGLMQKSIPCQLQIHRIVVDDTNSTKATGTDPLNWSLTPLQRWEVQNSADNVAKSYAAAKAWFYGSSEGVNWNDAHLVDDWPCTVAGKAKDEAKK